MAMLAGLYGFADVAGAMGWVARLLSVLFLVIMIATLALAHKPHHPRPHSRRNGPAT